MEGWIKLHRKIEKHWIWSNPVFVKAWIYCLFRANYADNKVLIGSSVEEVEPGSFITSIDKFSKATGLTAKQTRRFWKLLESDTAVVLNTTSKRTKITVCNYVDYQITGQSERQTKGKQRTNKGQTKGNGKEVKEVKEVKETTTMVSSGNGEKIIPVEIEKRKPNEKIILAQFDMFWKEYPRKTVKGKAFIAWQKLCEKKKELRPSWKEVRSAILAQKKSEQWMDRVDFIPHGATWINQRRWLDDPNEMKARPNGKVNPNAQVGSRAQKDLPKKNYSKIKNREL